VIRRLLAVAAAAALLAPVAAQASVRVRGVDASDYPRVRVTIVTSTPVKTPPTLKEAGGIATGLQTENLGRSKSVVLAVDRSQSMKGKPLAEAIAAARQFVATKPGADRIAVTTFATSAIMLTGFSPSTIDADGALRSVTDVDSKSGTKLYDDLVMAAHALATEPLEGRVIIIVTDGNETRSSASLKDVVAAARKAHAAIYVVAIESAKFTPAPLKSLAASTGGRYYGTASSAALRSVYAAIANELRRTWRLEYVTAAQPGDKLPLTVSVAGQGSALAQLSVPEDVGVDGSGGSALLPKAAFGFWGPFAIALAAALIVLLGTVLALSSEKGERLRAQLEPHLGRNTRRRREKRTKRDRLEVLSGLFRATENAFGQTRQWLKVQRLLERADVPLKTVEFLYLAVACGLGAIFLAALAGTSTLVLLALILLGVLAPFAVVMVMAKKRLNAFENQLPDLLLSLAAALKAGHSFRQGLQSIVDDGIEPTAKELKRVLTETRLGRPMEDALGEMAERINSENFSFIVTAVNVQTQVGGSLAGLFDMVADTVRQRQQFHRKIKSLTAMGRMSAYVLIGLPFFMAGAIWALNPGYMDPLFNTSMGHKLLLLGLTMMLIGSLLLKRIVSFKG
jgi:tight adherence protein B